MKKPNIVAQGAYGCVHKPSLTCKKNKNKNITYKKKVSKVMKTYYAYDELEEYKYMKEIDPTNKYHLGEPELCEVEMSKQNKTAIQKCELSKNKDIEKIMGELSLLVMYDGGYDFEKYGNMMSREPVTATNVNKIKMFWIEALTLLRGLKTMKENNICHHDLKNTNVVYDPKKNKCNFIDFGKMEYIPNSIVLCSDDNYKNNRNWWSYPLETCMTLKMDYNRIKMLEMEEKQLFVQNLVNTLVENRILPNFFLTVYIRTKKDKNEYIKEFSNFVLNDMNGVNYDKFIKMYFEKIDIFGMGLAYISVLYKTKKFLPNTFFKKMRVLCYKMFAANILERITIEDAIQEYQTILNEFETNK